MNWYEVFHQATNEPGLTKSVPLVGWEIQGAPEKKASGAKHRWWQSKDGIPSIVCSSLEQRNVFLRRGGMFDQSYFDNQKVIRFESIKKWLFLMLSNGSNIIQTNVETTQDERPNNLKLFLLDRKLVSLISIIFCTVTLNWLSKYFSKLFPMPRSFQNL